MSSNDNCNNVNNMEKLFEKFKEKMEPTEEQLKKLKELAKEYSGKSEEELVIEIMKLNKIFSENMGSEEYQEKLNRLERLRPLLNEEQRKKFDRLLDILKKTD